MSLDKEHGPCHLRRYVCKYPWILHFSSRVTFYICLQKALWRQVCLLGPSEETSQLWTHFHFGRAADKWMRVVIYVTHTCSVPRHFLCRYAQHAYALHIYAGKYVQQICKNSSALQSVCNDTQNIKINRIRNIFPIPNFSILSPILFSIQFFYSKSDTF